MEETSDVGGESLLGRGNDMISTVLLRRSYWPFRMTLRMMVSVFSLLMNPILLLPIVILGLILGLTWVGGLI